MNKDLTVGNPQKVLIKFCLPLFGSIIFQQLYNIADSWVAGRFIGEDALAAVGNSYEITLIFLAFAFGCNIGCSVITSRFFGAKDYKNMKTTIYTSIISSGILCLLLMLIGFVFGDGILSIIHTPSSLFEDSKLYLNIYILGLPFVFFYNISTGIFSALGDSRTPFYFLAISSTTNVCVDVLFVKVFSMGVSGVAWATFICQGVSCVVSLVVVFGRLKKIKLKEKPKIFDKRIFIRLVSIAIPSILQQSFISFGNMIIRGIINSYGTGVMAGYSTAIKLNNLVITSFTTIGNGVSNYASQNIGAGKYDRIGKGYKAAIRFVWCICVPIVLLYMIFPTAFLRFFMDEPSKDALRSGMLFLRIVAPFYFIAAMKLTADGFLRGAGLMKYFMIATFTDLLLRVVLSIVLTKTSLEYVGIWCSWPIGWCIATCISLYFYKHAKWDSV